ncbi:MAG: hypothetical protein JSS02_31405, partial [Planctomycetes bacterium]|nr:hypothetical protein [Planctomycetota bacterium]
MRFAFAFLLSIAAVPVDFALADDQPEAVAEIDLDQVADDELVGRVIDIDGEPIAGVEVDVWT